MNPTCRRSCSFRSFPDNGRQEEREQKQVSSKASSGGGSRFHANEGRGVGEKTPASQPPSHPASQSPAAPIDRIADFGRCRRWLIACETKIWQALGSRKWAACESESGRRERRTPHERRTQAGASKSSTRKRKNPSIQESKPSG